MVKPKSMRKKLQFDLMILICTYAAALAILHLGHMNPYVVALMPCLAFTFSFFLKR